MTDYEPIMSFGEDHAEAHDDLQRFSKTPSRSEQAGTVAFLEKLAGGGPALELAIGTGWIALPLAARGIRVDGIDLSLPGDYLKIHRSFVEGLEEEPGDAVVASGIIGLAHAMRLGAAPKARGDGLRHGPGLPVLRAPPGRSGLRAPGRRAAPAVGDGPGRGGAPGRRDGPLATARGRRRRRARPPGIHAVGS